METNKTDATDEKFGLIAISFVVGGVVGVMRGTSTDSVAVGVILGGLSVLAYPILGAAATAMSYGLHWTCHLGEVRQWPLHKRLVIATFWPVTVLYYVVLFAPLLVINLLFRDEPQVEEKRALR
jgi:hypothetical protein